MVGSVIDGVADLFWLEEVCLLREELEGETEEDRLLRDLGEGAYEDAEY